MILGSRIILSRCATDDDRAITEIARRSAKLGARAFKVCRKAKCLMLALTVERGREAAIRKLAMSSGWDFATQGYVKGY